MPHFVQTANPDPSIMVDQAITTTVYIYQTAIGPPEVWELRILGPFGQFPVSPTYSTQAAAQTAMETLAASLSSPTSPFNALGIAAIPSLTAGANTTVAVTSKPAYEDTNYVAVASVIGGASLLGALGVTATTIVDEDTVNVTIHNGGLSTVTGGQVLVSSVHN